MNLEDLAPSIPHGLDSRPVSPPPRPTTDRGPPTRSPIVSVDPHGAEPSRLWIMSDLRVDHTGFRLPVDLPACDAVVVAGNVRPGLVATMRWLARELDGRQGDRPVVLVPGPLEHSDGTPMRDALDRAADLAHETGIIVLDGGSTCLRDGRGHGLHIVGATLWVDFRCGGSPQASHARGHARARWDAVKRVNCAHGTPIQPHDVAGAHARGRAYVEDALSAIWTGAYGATGRPLVPDVRSGDRAVVVTAFPPSRRCLPPGLARPLLDPWATAWHASDLDALFDAPGAPRCWIHGGVPHGTDLRLGRTRVVANPLGRDPTDGFDPGRVVVV